MSLSMGDHLKIMAMQAEGHGPVEIAQVTGIAARTVRRILGPSWYEKHDMEPIDKVEARRAARKRETEARRAAAAAPPPPVPAPKPPPDMGRSFLPQYERHITRLEIPPEVLAEHDVWEAEAMADRDLTATQLGDPVPSRSALGRRGKS